MMARFFPFFPLRSAGSKWPRNVVRPLHQQSSQIRIAFLADVHLRFAPPRVSPSRLQPQVAAHVTALAKAIVWVFPKIKLCLECGFAQFEVPESELGALKQSSPAVAEAGTERTA